MFAIDLAKLFSIFALFHAVSLCKADLSCIDDHGNPVDWYMVYKFPKINGDSRFQTGYAYAYISSDDTNEPINDDLLTSRKVDDHESLIFLRNFKDSLAKLGGSFSRSSGLEKTGSRSSRSKKLQRAKENNSKWVASDKLISDPSSLVMRTLAPAYDPALLETIDSVFYNDDPENTEVDSRDDSDDSDNEESEPVKIWTKQNIPNRVAHAKGSILMEQKSNTGIWITHSVPKFPNVREHFLEYPETAIKFGQTLMCISFNLDKTGAKLIDHLINMRPLVYDRHVSDSLLKQIPRLEDLGLYRDVKFKRVSNPSLLIQSIVTQAGQVMKIYSKPPTILQDFYSGWLDGDLGSDLYVQSWRRGSGGLLDSTCPKSDYHINNVRDLQYSRSLTWDYRVDHSKWTISEDKEMAAVCIGDSNRMASQFKRGSGAVCMRCPTCWATFSNTIADTEPCPLKVTKGPRKMDRTLSTRVQDYLNSGN